MTEKTSRDPGEARYLDAGGRLRRGPSALLVETAFNRELAYADALYEGISYADLAHVLMLAEAGVIPEAPARELLTALVALHDQGMAALRLDAKWGDLYNNRDSELQRRVPAAAGWLHAGRARREALTLGWLIHLRVALAAARRDTAALLRVFAHLGERHAGDVMPDFTYLQHAQPTTPRPLPARLRRAAAARRRAPGARGAAARRFAGRRRQHQRRSPAPRPRAHARAAPASAGERARPRRHVAARHGDQPDGRAGVDRHRHGPARRGVAAVGHRRVRLRRPRRRALPGECHHAQQEESLRRCRHPRPGPRARRPADERDRHQPEPSGQIDNRNTSYDALPRGLETVDAWCACSARSSSA